MQPLVIIEIPGLTCGMVERHAPRLKALSEGGRFGSLDTVVPAVTMPVHASLMTGLSPSEHGVIANGWFDRGSNEVRMWQQSERLVKGEKVWEAGRKRDSEFTCLKYFWWPGMASTADVFGNVRPVYYVDGRKGPDMYMSRPGLAEELQEKFGTFPLFKFWGPGVDISSSQWIADSARYLFDNERPTLSLIYLTHLDYRQQTHGPEDPSFENEIKAFDDLAGDLIDHFRSQGAEVMVVSGYHMNEVKTPVHLNRILRGEGWLQVLKNDAGELIDYGCSDAFAVPNHQVAHVYVMNPEVKPAVKEKLSSVSGIASVLDGEEIRIAGLEHPNSGELVVMAEKNAWFTYYYWSSDGNAPDFARTVAIHDKPGYDPCEMIVDPEIAFPRLKIAWKLFQKVLGFRYTMDFVPLDASLVKGSHGLKPDGRDESPVFISSAGSSSGEHETILMTEMKEEMLRVIFEGSQ